MKKALGLTVFLALSLAPSLGASDRPAPILGETNPLALLTGNRFQGAWWLTRPPGSPSILSITRSGAFVMQSATDFGGFNPVSFSPIRGIWQRSARRSAKAIGLRFVVAPDKKIVSAERVRIEMSFGSDYQSLEGTLTLEEVACESLPTPPGAPVPEFPSCPDITTAPAEVVRGPIPFSAKRFSFDAGAE